MADLEIVFNFCKVFDVKCTYDAGHILDEVRFWNKWFVFNKHGKLEAQGDDK